MNKLPFKGKLTLDSIQTDLGKEVKEVISKEKYMRVKNLNTELKAALREYMEQFRQVDEDRRRMEIIIQDQEIELKNLRSKANDQTKDQEIDALQAKLIRKTEEYEKLRSEYIADSYKVEVAHKEELQSLERKNKQLREDLDVSKQSLQRKDEEITTLDVKWRETFDLLKKRSQEQETELTQKLDQQSRAAKEYKQSLNETQARLALLQEQLKNAETNSENKNKKNQQLKAQNAELIVRIGDIQKNNTELQSEISQLKESKKRNTEIIELLEKDYKQQQEVISLQEEKLKQYDQQYQYDQKEISLLESDLHYYKDELYLTKQQVNQQETELNQMQSTQDQELQLLERKIDALVDELRTTKEEALEFKSKANELKKALLYQESQTDLYKDKHAKSKAQVKYLEQSSKNLEEKCKVLDAECEQYQRLALKQTNSQVSKEQKQHKARVIDEIQSMIKQHKLR